MLIGSHFNFFFPYFLIPAPAGCRRHQSHLAGLCTLQKLGFWGGEKEMHVRNRGDLLLGWKGGSCKCAPNTSLQPGRGAALRDRPSHLDAEQSSAEAQQCQTLQGTSPKNSLCFIAPLWSTAPALLWKQGDAAAVPVHTPCSRGSAVQHAERPRHCF